MPADDGRGDLRTLENLFMVLCFVWFVGAFVVQLINESVSTTISAFLFGIGTGFGLASVGLWRVP